MLQWLEDNGSDVRAVTVRTALAPCWGSHGCVGLFAETRACGATDRHRELSARLTARAARDPRRGGRRGAAEYPSEARVINGHDDVYDSGGGCSAAAAREGESG